MVSTRAVWVDQSASQHCAQQRGSGARIEMEVLAKVAKVDPCVTRGMCRQPCERTRRAAPQEFRIETEILLIGDQPSPLDVGGRGHPRSDAGRTGVRTRDGCRTR